MKFSEAQIAALVLGYLKSEKLQDVANDFIKNCSYFEDDNIKMGKYFATRVSGMSLVDFLHEYAIINSIVQGRLEETDYFETHTRTTLVEQLLYILDSNLQTVVTSTSISRNSSEVDTTPVDTLPGNETSSPKTTKKRNNKKPEEEDDEDVIAITEVLTQSLLENKELHEKIAENINLVRSVPESSTGEDQLRADASHELDAVIKTVVEKTEEDPIYHKLIDEIIGTTVAEIPPVKKSPYNTRSTTENLKSPQNETAKSIENNGDVYVFEGTLDTYLKTSGVTTVNPQLYPTNLIVTPVEPTKQQFYIVNNNQAPVLKMSEKELMSIPTVIVSDEQPVRKPKRILPKPAVTTIITTASTVTPSTRSTASHVRNLDFSTPQYRVKMDENEQTTLKSTWDSDLRELVKNCTDGKPPPVKRKKNPKKKGKTKSIEEEEKIVPKTPEKNEIEPSSDPLLHCTPFSDVINEQLKGVDLISIDTPSIPITPGFAITPGEMLLNNYNNRGTDYSTSSSYYQPSDTEQGKSLEQMLEEVRESSPPPENKDNDFAKLKILSDVILEHGKIEEHRKQFNNTMIGKKNLSLIKENVDLSETDEEEEKTNLIKNIIGNVNMENKLAEEEEKKKVLREELEEKRKRTIEKIKKEAVVKKPGRGRKKGSVNTKKKTTTTTTKRKSKSKKEIFEPEVEIIEQEVEDEAEKLVKGLAQRGIHLIPKKTPKKGEETEERQIPEEEGLFERIIFTECEVIARDNTKKKNNTRNYDTTILKKTLSVKVFMDDLNEEVSRELAWTNLNELLVLNIEEDLMDFALVGLKQSGRKRRAKSIDNDLKQAEKRNKNFENLDLLKKINVDDFLDKVHG